MYATELRISFYLGDTAKEEYWCNLGTIDKIYLLSVQQ